jgi:hypothetical protein
MLLNALSTRTLLLLRWIVMFVIRDHAICLTQFTPLPMQVAELLHNHTGLLQFAVRDEPTFPCSVTESRNNKSCHRHSPLCCLCTQQQAAVLLAWRVVACVRNALRCTRIKTCHVWHYTSIYIYTHVHERRCGLVVRVPGYTTEMYCVSCDVRTEFIYVM